MPNLWIGVIEKRTPIRRGDLVCSCWLGKPGLFLALQPRMLGCTYNSTRSSKRSSAQRTASRSFFRPVKSPVLRVCQGPARSGVAERRTMTLCKRSVAAELQSMNPDAASTSRVGRVGLGEAKSSRAMSKEILMASRSAQMVLISCLALRKPRATLLVSEMICDGEYQLEGVS